MTKENRHIDLEELIFILSGSKWSIAGIVLLSLVAGYAYITLADPIYKADALLQVEDKSKVVGELTDISKLLENRNAVSEKVRLIKSRRVLSQVVDDLDLDIVVEPKYLANAARHYGSFKSNDENGPQADADVAYAWRHERIQVAQFDVPEAYFNKPFIIIKDKNDSFRLYGPNRELIGAGVVGELMEARLNGLEQVRLLIHQLVGISGGQFTIKKLQHLKAVNNLSEALKIEELDKRPNVVQNYGLVQISLEGTNPGRVEAIVNAVISAYIGQNMADKTEEAEKALKYLQEQTDSVSDQLAESEYRLNQYRLTKGSIDLSKETDAFITRSVALESKISELKRTRNDLLQMFTPKHVRIVSLDSQLNSLIKERDALEQRILELPDTQQTILRLSRDVEVNRELYTLLLNNAQELKVVKAGGGENTRIIDSAVMPIEPVRPKKEFALLLFAAVGMLSGIGWALFKKSLYGGIDDPDEVESLSGLPVYAVVPHSAHEKEENWFRRIFKKSGAGIKTSSSPHNYTIESIRSLRTTINNVQKGADNNLILITGPAPNVGKSFISVNLASAWAQCAEKVLIIDADLRKGGINHYFDLEAKHGLAELIMGSINVNEAIHKTDVKGLYVMPSGAFPQNPSELLTHSRFAAIVEACRKNFDKVIIDSPPVIGLSDAAIIGKNAGITLLVMKAGQHRIREIEQSIKNMKHAGVVPSGIIFNNMNMSRGKFSYGKYYGYAYTFTYKP